MPFQSAQSHTSSSSFAPLIERFATWRGGQLPVKFTVMFAQFVPRSVRFPAEQLSCQPSAPFAALMTTLLACGLPARFVVKLMDILISTFPSLRYLKIAVVASCVTPLAEALPFTSVNAV